MNAETIALIKAVGGGGSGSGGSGGGGITYVEVELTGNPTETSIATTSNMSFADVCAIIDAGGDVEIKVLQRDSGTGELFRFFGPYKMNFYENGIEANWSGVFSVGDTNIRFISVVANPDRWYSYILEAAATAPQW